MFTISKKNEIQLIINLFLRVHICRYIILGGEEMRKLNSSIIMATLLILFIGCDGIKPDKEVLEIEPAPKISEIKSISMLPDLIFLHVRKWGEIYQDKKTGDLHLDFRIVVYNQGDNYAIGTGKWGLFKIAAFYKDPQRYVPIPIIMGSGDGLVHGYALGDDYLNHWHIWAIWIYPHDVAVGVVKVILPKLPSGSVISIIFEVDSCTGDEFKPDYCRVKESREDNNFSNPILVTIP